MGVSFSICYFFNMFRHISVLLVDGESLGDPFEISTIRREVCIFPLINRILKFPRDSTQANTVYIQ